MNDDIERTVRESLDRHAAAIHPRVDEIDAVYGRVDTRRRRRRSVAVVGSVIAVGAGVVGFAALRGSEPGASSTQYDGALGLPEAATTWSCSGYLGTDGDRDLYADCYPASTGDVGVPSTVVCAAPASSVPMIVATVVEGTAVIPAASTPPFDPCAIAPEYYEPECLIPTTPPPVATTIESAAGCEPPHPLNTAPATTVPVLDCRVGPPPDPTTTTIINAPPISGSEQIYTVVAGDSVIGIARRHGVAPEILANYNVWWDCLDHPLLVGELVRIPPGAIVPDP